MTMKILIHICCADCGLHLLQDKELVGNEIGFYFYNPNIHPQEEYYSRLRAFKQIFANKGYKLIIPHWSPKEYFKEIKKIIDKEDPQIRCPHCWKLRLEQSFKYAKENDYEAMTTTMLTSGYMDREIISKLGTVLARKYRIKFLISKDVGCDLTTSGFYKQNYCGCIYSLKQRMEEKFLLV
jgi:epoxyqueuosine reductase